MSHTEFLECSIMGKVQTKADKEFTFESLRGSIIAQDRWGTLEIFNISNLQHLVQRPLSIPYRVDYESDDNLS